MRIPTHIVIDTRDGWTWWRDKDGDPFTETTATTFAELLNGDCKPGHRTYIVAGVTPVLSPELLTAVLRDKDVTAIES